MATDVLLVRHGQTASNLHRMYMGWSSEDLDETGQMQVRRLATRIAHLPIAAVYSSPLKRAYSTASLLAEPHHLEVKTSEDLIEIQFGEWQGLNLEAVRRGWPDIWKAWREHPDQESIPGGESFSQVTQRATRALKSLLQEHKGSKVLVVSHEIIIKIMLMTALDSDYNIYRRFTINNASLSLIRSRGNWLHVVTINDVSHLDG